MNGPQNTLELIEQIRKEDGKRTPKFQDVSRYLSFKAREKGIPLTGQFELTPLCNFDCKMCYVHLQTEQMHGRSILSVSTWKDIMLQAWKAGMLHAALTGGECLTYQGFDELFLYLHSLGCEVMVLTNGYLLNKERIEFFKKHKPAKIQITLYGSDDETYERVTGRRVFTEVLGNIQCAVDAGLPICLTITPNTYMGENVLDTVCLAKKTCKNVSVNSGVFAPREETGRSGDNGDPALEMYLRIYQLLDQLNGYQNIEVDEEKLPPVGGPCHECAEKGLTCAGGRSSFVVDWKGTLMPCNRMQIIQANVLKEGFQDAWKKVNREANNWPRVPECKDCVYNSVCNNCPGNIMDYTEPGKQPIKLCERTRFFVQHGVSRIPECE